MVHVFARLVSSIEVDMKRIAVPLVAAILVLCCLPSAAQAPTSGVQIPRPGTPTGAAAPGMPGPRERGAARSGTASLRGRIISSQTGTPLRRAQVVVNSTEGRMRRVATTDGEGRYEFRELPAGRFSISAIKAGYVTQQYGQRRPFEPGTPVSLADGESVERIDFALQSGSVITVRVTDDFNEPLAGAQIQVQRFQYGTDGHRRLTGAPGGPGFMSVTDDRGEYRAYGLMPGEYVVSATVRSSGDALDNPDDTTNGFAPTYFPGTVSVADAQPVSVGAGEERSVQFALVAARLSRISGTVMTSEGVPAAGAQVMVTTRQGNGGSSSGGGRVAADGAFSISGIAPGEHSIDVRPQMRPGQTGGEFASVPVTVSGSDITGMRIVTGHGATVRGRVVFEGTSPRNSPGSSGRLRVMASPAEPTNRTMFFGGNPRSNGVVDENGNFELAMATGSVFFSVTAPQSWVTKSITLEGNDITDEPFDSTGKQTISGLVIRLTDKLTLVSGRVSDGRGQLMRDYVVVIQPAEEKEPIVAGRLTRTARPDTNGRFETRGMRPGRYIATAIEGIEQGRQFSPEFREQLRRGAREFSLREGETVALDLTLTPGL
jgi:protocatechuate 3,4-dioxygenase beta subunit